MKKKSITELPSIEELEEEISRKKKIEVKTHLLRNAIFSLITVAALTALVSVLFLPVLKTLGTSMTPTFQDGELVVAVRTSEAKPGDLIAFYFNNKIFVKRVVAKGGSLVDMDEEGNLYVDGVLQEESYLTEKSPGNGDLEFPFQVPEGQYFVLGDNRSNSADSRSSVLGCVDPEDFLGRIIFRVWPLNRIGPVS